MTLLQAVDTDVDMTPEILSRKAAKIIPKIDRTLEFEQVLRSGLPLFYSNEISFEKSDLFLADSTPVSSVEFKAVLNVPNTVNITIQIFDGSSEEVVSNIPVTPFVTANVNAIIPGKVESPITSDPIIIKSNGNAVKLYAADHQYVTPDLSKFVFISAEGNKITVDVLLDKDPSLATQTQTEVIPGGYVIQAVSSGSPTLENRMTFLIPQDSVLVAGVYTCIIIFKTYSS